MALIELSELRPGEWTLVGGQMVFLHTMEHGVEPPRCRLRGRGVGGQGPMETLRNDSEVEQTLRDFYEAGKPTVVCHATAVLLDTTDSSGELIVAGQEWTAFTAAEEEYVGQKLQPFWIETEAAGIDGTTFLAGPPMASHVVVAGSLITGQQQNSGAEAARAVLEQSHDRGSGNHHRHWRRRCR